MSRTVEQVDAQHENGTLQDFHRKIEDWRFRGYRVDRLEAVKNSDRSVRQAALQKFEKDIRELEEVRQVLDLMKQQGLDDFVADVEPLLKDPDNLQTVAQKLIELDGIIESLSEPTPEHQGDHDQQRQQQRTAQDGSTTGEARGDGASKQRDDQPGTARRTRSQTNAAKSTRNDEVVEEWHVEFEKNDRPPTASGPSTDPPQRGVPSSGHSDGKPADEGAKKGALLLQGKSAYSEGRYQAALALFEKVLENDPNNLEARFFRSRTQKRLRTKARNGDQDTIEQTQPIGADTQSQSKRAPPTASIPRPASDTQPQTRSADREQPWVSAGDIPKPSFTAPERPALQPSPYPPREPMKAEPRSEPDPEGSTGSGPIPTPPHHVTEEEMEKWFREYKLHQAELAQLKRKKEQEYIEQQKESKLTDQIDELKKSGVDVSRLEERIDEGFQSLHSEFNLLTDQVQHLIDLSQRLDQLAEQGYRTDVEDLKAKMFDLQHIGKLQTAVEKLERRAQTEQDDEVPLPPAPKPAAARYSEAPPPRSRPRENGRENEPRQWDTKEYYPTPYTPEYQYMDAPTEVDEASPSRYAPSGQRDEDEISKLRQEIATLEEDLRRMETEPEPGPRADLGPGYGPQRPRPFPSNHPQPGYQYEAPRPREQPTHETHPPTWPEHYPDRNGNQHYAEQSHRQVPQRPYPDYRAEHEPRSAPRSPPGLCERCHGSGRCILCHGGGVCSWCNGTGYGEKRNAEGRCYYCNGAGYCLWCNGSGRCEQCRGTGRKTER